MTKYYDAQMLALANPANSKNELQALGDGFRNLYKDYANTRLTNNEIDLSDLRLGYEFATQDDKIKQSNLQTQVMQNKVDLSGLELETAKKTQGDVIAQAHIKTANDMEAYKQNQTKSAYLPKQYEAQINQATASANNLLANAKRTNQATSMENYNFTMNKAYQDIRSDLNELSIKNNDFSMMNSLQRYKVYLNMLDNQINNTNDEKIKNELLFKKRVALKYFNASAEQDTQDLMQLNSQEKLFGANSYTNKEKNKSAEITTTKNNIDQYNKLIKENKKELEKTNLSSNEVSIIHKKIKENENNLNKEQNKLSALQNASVSNFNAKNTISNAEFDSLKLNPTEKSLFTDVEENLSNASGLIKDIDEFLEWIQKTNVNAGKASYYASYWTGKGNAYDLRKKMNLLKSNLFSDKAKKLKLPVDYLNKALDDTNDSWLSIDNVNNQLKNIRQMLITSKVNELNRVKNLNSNMYNYLNNTYGVLNNEEKTVVKDFRVK